MHKRKAEDEEETDASSEDSDSEYDYSEEEEDADDADDDEEGDEGGDAHEGKSDAAASTHVRTDLASAISGVDAKSREKEDPRSLLLYPIPDEDEDDDGLTTASEDSEWEPVEVKKKKVRYCFAPRTFWRFDSTDHCHGRRPQRPRTVCAIWRRSSRTSKD